MEACELKHYIILGISLLTIAELFYTQTLRQNPDREALHAMRTRLHKLEKIVDQKDKNIEKALRLSKSLEKKIDELVMAYTMLKKSELLRETKDFNPEICAFLDKNSYGALDSVRYLFPALNVASYKTQFTVWVEWNGKSVVVHRETLYEDDRGSSETVSEMTFKK